MTIDEVLNDLPAGWRFSVGHIPHWYGSAELPKRLRRKGFEAYVLNGEPIGSRNYVFESADAANPAQALELALSAAKARAHGQIGASAK